MERIVRDFKGIWIPREIWLSEGLSLMEKVLFVEINSLDNERGCYASNRYFAEFFGVSDRHIRNIISSLKMKGFVTVTVRNKNERVIRTAQKWHKATAEQMRKVQDGRAGLVHTFDVKRSDGVGKRLPGR
jgi:hypothetical protein